MNSKQIGLQIWTIRDVTEKDYMRGITEVAKIGYAGIEAGDTGPFSDNEFKNVLSDLNLECIAFHVALPQLESDLARYVDRNLNLGAKYIVVPWIGEEDRSPEGYRDIAGKLRDLADKVSESGLVLCYHNHNFEFEDLGNIMGYDILSESMKDTKLNAELDVYWAVHGYQDPVSWINRLAGQLPLLHMKDMESGPERRFCEVGAGIIDMSAVAQAGDRAGVKWYIVEQDVCLTDPIECVRFSYQTLLDLCN